MFSCFCCKAKVPNEDFSDDPIPPKKEMKSLKKVKQSKLVIKNSKNSKQILLQEKIKSPQQIEEVKQEQGGKDKNKYRQLTLDQFWKSTKSPTKYTNKQQILNAIKYNKRPKMQSFLSTKTQDEPSTVQETDQLKAKLNQNTSNFHSAFGSSRKSLFQNSEEKKLSSKPTQESEDFMSQSSGGIFSSMLINQSPDKSISPSPIKSESSTNLLFGSSSAANKPSNLNLNRVSEKPLFSSKLFTNKVPVHPFKSSPFSESSSSLQNSTDSNKRSRLFNETPSFEEKNSPKKASLFDKNYQSQSSIFGKKSSLSNLFDPKKLSPFISPEKSDDLMTHQHFKPKQLDPLTRRQSQNLLQKPSTLFNNAAATSTTSKRSNTVKFVTSANTSVICYSCGQRGHYSPECPIKPKGDLSKYHCFHCGERGHFAQSCPDKYY